MMRIRLIAPVLALMLAVTIAGPAAAAGRTLTTTLLGAEEVPGPGDPDGSGFAMITLNSGQGEVCWELTVSNISPATAAHIHVGEAGVAGPVVVSLSPPTDGSSEGCVATDPALIKAIRKNPTNYYVNVHNAEYPAGALRGQLGD
jgi:CHRD domain